MWDFAFSLMVAFQYSSILLILGSRSFKIYNSNPNRNTVIDTYIFQFNGQEEYGAIKSYYFSCGWAVIFHHSKTHCHWFNIWTERYWKQNSWEHNKHFYKWLEKRKEKKSTSSKVIIFSEDRLSFSHSFSEVSSTLVSGWLIKKQSNKTGYLHKGNMVLINRFIFASD